MCSAGRTTAYICVNVLTVVNSTSAFMNSNRQRKEFSVAWNRQCSRGFWNVLLPAKSIPHAKEGLTPVSGSIFLCGQVCHSKCLHTPLSTHCYCLIISGLHKVSSRIRLLAHVGALPPRKSFWLLTINLVEVRIRSANAKSLSQAFSNLFSILMNSHTKKKHPAIDIHHPPPHTSLKPLRCDNVFWVVLNEHMDFIHRLRCDPLTLVREQLLFSVIVWIYYAAALCGTNPDVCEDEWVLQLPLRAFSIQGTRTAVFEYAWAYACIQQLSQAFFYGIWWTFNDASLALSAQALPHWTIWQKRWTYMSNLFLLSLAYVLEPLLLFFVSRDVGRFCWLGPTSAESAVYTN